MHVFAVLGLARGGQTEDERKEGEEGSEREARHYGCLCFGTGDPHLSSSFYSFFTNVPRPQFDN